ncbi:MAG TPA: hypothetical protein VM531_06075 [Sphingomicrobium sp.]|jgi:hypothetical protein|nr:hypothetical protein [Sphingomicrobium sp.]
MRMIVALPLLALAACQVTKDDANDSVTVEYNQDVAENGLEDAANLAGNVAATVANDVEQAADKVENTDIDVDVDTNANANSN